MCSLCLGAAYACVGFSERMRQLCISSVIRLAQIQPDFGHFSTDHLQPAGCKGGKGRNRLLRNSSRGHVLEFTVPSGSFVSARNGTASLLLIRRLLRYAPQPCVVDDTTSSPLGQTPLHFDPPSWSKAGTTLRYAAHPSNAAST